MMNENVYQAVFNEIAPLLPPKWSKLVVYLEYGKDSYSFSFFYNTADNTNYVKCFDMQGVPEEKIHASFKVIDSIVAPERKNSNGTLWSNMTMVITADGSMYADFDYTDLSAGTYQYKKAWKQKYLQ